MLGFNFFNSKIFLLLEFIFIFLLLPLLLFLSNSIPVLPILWIVALWCFFILKKEGNFPNEKFISFKGVKKTFLTIFSQFMIITIILVLFIILFMTDKTFFLIREKPFFWMIVMIIYPILSVYPQEIVYRMFFFYRYKQFFDNKNSFIYINAFLFAYMHIFFHNWMAVILTFAGGMIFAKLYERTNSLIIVTISHSLYGCMIFTVGLGEYFYSGTLLSILNIIN